MNKFNIGDKVFRATMRSVEKFNTCPDCWGKKYLRVILGDDSEVTIDCAGCDLGYEPPRGYVTHRAYEPQVEGGKITGIEINENGVSYNLSGYIVEEKNVSEVYEDALKQAAVLAAEYEESEKQRMLRKEKDARTWAWHATYHRGAIKRAQKDLEYHTAKLNVASKYKKESSGN